MRPPRDVSAEALKLITETGPENEIDRLRAYIVELERIVYLARAWAGFQSYDSREDQKTDARLREEAQRATFRLMEAVE